MASYHQHSNYQPSKVVQHDTKPHPRAAYIMPTTLVLHPAALQVTETNVIAPTEVDKRAPVVPRSASPNGASCLAGPVWLAPSVVVLATSSAVVPR